MFEYKNTFGVSVWFETQTLSVMVFWCQLVDVTELSSIQKSPKAELFLMMMGTKVGKNGSIAGGRTW